MTKNTDTEISARIERLTADILESVTQAGAEDNMTVAETQENFGLLYYTNRRGAEPVDRHTAH